MGSLSSSVLSISNALNAYSQALSVEQQNIANSTTPGYATHRTVLTPTGGLAGGGDTVAIQSTGNIYADAAVQSASSQASYSQTMAATLSPLVQQFDVTGSTGIL